MQRSLEGFTLIELVGFGGAGEVWRARPDGGGADVALKWLSDQTVDTDLLSCSRLHDFTHPHVARLLDLRRDGSLVVLVQEFIAGVSLAALLADRDVLSGAEVVTLLTPVAEALGAAHDAGLMHGNLTPTAVIVTPDGRPILTDLGVWQSLGPTFAGTARLEYLDPSVARGGPLTKASDVFGVAAIGFHALTGRPPWTASSGPDSWELAAEGSGVDLRPLRQSTAAPLADVIARGLSEQPRHRGSARAFAADVRDAIEPEPLLMAGPYVWPDLPPLPDAVDLASMDVASELRRGSSARHAAAPSTRRARDQPDVSVRSIGRGSSRLRSAARIMPRRAVVGALVALAVLTVLVLGLGWNASNAVPAPAGGPIGQTSGPSADEAESESDDPGGGIDEQAIPESAHGWVALLSLLYDRRALAFGTGADALLDEVFTADSPQLVADTTELTRLADAGQVLRGFAPRIVDILEISVDGDHASLQITDEFASYETVPAADTQAGALANNPGRGPATVSMTLIRGDDGWRIHTAQRLD